PPLAGGPRERRQRREDAERFRDGTCGMDPARAARSDRDHVGERLEDAARGGAGQDRMKPRVAITEGDPAGIGPEIARRAAADPRVLAVCEPVLYGAEGPTDLQPGVLS